MHFENSGYIYGAAWLIIAIYLFYQAFKTTKFFFFLACFFVYLSTWFVLDEVLTDVDMFNGIYNWIFRGVAVVVLIVCIAVYFLHKRKQDAEFENYDD